MRCVLKLLSTLQQGDCAEQGEDGNNSHSSTAVFSAINPASRSRAKSFGRETLVAFTAHRDDDNGNAEKCDSNADKETVDSSAGAAESSTISSNNGDNDDDKVVVFEKIVQGSDVSSSTENAGNATIAASLSSVNADQLSENNNTQRSTTTAESDGEADSKYAAILLDAIKDLVTELAKSFDEASICLLLSHCVL